MLSISCALARTARLGLRPIPLVLASFVLAPFATTEAGAQSASCGEIQKFLLDRKSIAGTLQPKKGQQLDARFACGGFGKLVANGNALIKWVDTNKDWCQIPESFVTGIKTDHDRATSIRAKACGVAAQQAAMEKKAKEGGSGGLLGGGGLEGPTRLPQGAL